MGKIFRISNNFSCTNFIWSLLRLGEWKIAKMVAVHWPRWPPCPYMVKTLKNLLLQNRGRLGAESLLKWSGTGGLPKLLNNGRTSLLPYAFVWEKTFKNLILQNRGCLMAESLHILLGTSACLQWLCHSGERTVACGPLVFFRENKTRQAVHMKCVKSYLPVNWYT